MTQVPGTNPDEAAGARRLAPWRTALWIAASLIPLALLVYAIASFVFAADPMAGT